MVTAATIYMSLLGPEGLRRVAIESHAKTRALTAAAEDIQGVEAVFTAPNFHEVVLRLPVPASSVLEGMRQEGILAGVDLSAWFPELLDCLLVCATETKTDEDIQTYVQSLREQVEAARTMG